MSKELLEQIDSMIERLAIIELHTGKSEGILIDKNTLLDIQRELELQEIKNAKPSEALNCLEELWNELDSLIEKYEPKKDVKLIYYCKFNIKDALQKTQEQEKENKSYKLALNNINKLVADAYNSKMSFELAINCINEILKEVDWRDKDEVK